jgi:hypothetical protein
MKLAVLLLCVGIALGDAAGAKAWFANQWRSPTRNIACKFYPDLDGVRCETENDAFALGLVRGGGRAFRTSYVNIPYRVPVLRYGYNWRGGGIRCASSFNGMTCRTGVHGFFINRTSYRLW